jgi:hypothetical protein
MASVVSPQLALVVTLAMDLACTKTTPMALTPEGGRVRVSDSTAVNGCESVGDFIGGTGARANATGPWEPNQVRNLVAERGGTDVVFDPEAKGHIIGRGYRCK